MATEPIVAESLVRIPSSVYARSFGDELVLLDFGRGEYFGLDEVGAVVWRLCEAGEPLHVIAAALVERYAVSYEAALDDIVELVTHMRDSHLVTIVSE